MVIIQLALVFPAFVVAAILPALVGARLELILLMLGIIAIEIFLISIGYLEHITNHIKGDISLEYANDCDISIDECLKLAKKDVFIYGNTLTSYVAHNRNRIKQLANLSERGVLIDLYNIHPCYICANPELCKIINYESPEIFQENYADFKRFLDGKHAKQITNLKVYSIKGVFAVNFVGIDIRPLPK